MRTKRKSYSKEFKRQAVEMLEARAGKPKEVCAAVGVPHGMLYRWRAELEKEGAEAFRGRGNRLQLEEENRQLRREVERLKLEQEILKKAAAYFAKHLG